MEAGFTAAALSMLTGREKQILDLLVCNMTSKEIAAALGISSRTIDNHCVTIIRKFQVKDRYEAARCWVAATAALQASQSSPQPAATQQGLTSADLCSFE